MGGEIVPQWCRFTNTLCDLVTYNLLYPLGWICPNWTEVLSFPGPGAPPPSPEQAKPQQGERGFGRGRGRSQEEGLIQEVMILFNIIDKKKADHYFWDTKTSLFVIWHQLSGQISLCYLFDFRIESCFNNTTWGSSNSVCLGTNRF